MNRFFLFAALVALPAFAAEFEGVTSADTITVDGKTLTLNGMGLRRKFIVNVYVGSLYLEHASKNAADILKVDEVRRMEMKMLRDVDKKAMVEAIMTGVEKAAGDKFATYKPRLDKFIEKFSDLKKGEVFVLQYTPGKGSRVEGAKDAAVAEGKDFADVLFSVWIGSSPVDDGLKKGLLGGK
jgi:hypothetical protein